MPARLIGDGAELDRAYQEFVKEEIAKRKAAEAVDNSEEGGFNYKYHEGAIPRYVNKLLKYLENVYY